MKIRRINYVNFRNFKDAGSVEFATDGKVTLIYGGNGAGKTTFHQLFQWIIYGETHFNKTSGDEMYNLEYEASLSVGTQFKVRGEIEFEQDGRMYKLIRTWNYEKNLGSSILLHSEFVIIKQDLDGGWNSLPKPEEIVEQLLPVGLRNYFFFDGEGMIADLKVKGKDSALSLKNALYLLLGLNVYDRAVDIIGDTDKRTTVLGMLYDGITKDNTDSDINKLTLTKITAEDQKEKIRKELDELNNQKIQKTERLVKISEQIGSAKSHEQHEKDRQKCLDFVRKYKSFIEDEYKKFGEDFVETFPRIMMSKVIGKAEVVLKEHGKNSNFLPGINKELVDALIKSDRCICGNILSSKEKEILKGLYECLPPLGYDGLYRAFSNKVEEWGKGFDPKLLENHIIKIGDYMDEIKRQEEEITSIDKNIALDSQFDSLVTERNILADDLKEIDAPITQKEFDIKKCSAMIRKCMAEIDKKTALSDSNKDANRKIEIMKMVQEHFKTLIKDGSKEYSAELQTNIISLLGQMMEAERDVEVHEDFSLRVFDQYGSESKSEGQFASVSFAYICGIFKLLQEKDVLKNKEYPLVLDAPFSKLSDDIRRKVITVLPKYAPQVIIMSKDIIHELFEKGEVGKIYEICSNRSQNVAYIKERVEA